MLANNYIPALKYGAKILPTEIMGGGMTVFGTVYYVDADNGSDTNGGLDPTSALATIPAAYALVATNKDDVIVLSAYSPHKLTSMLTISKSRVHFIGASVASRARGSRSRIETTGAGATTDIAMVLNTGTGNTFHNIKFSNTFSVAENLSAVTDCGPNSYFENCQFQAQGSAHLTNENAASLILSSGEGIYRNCGIGQMQLLTTSTAGQELLIKAQAGYGSGKAGGNIFDACYFEAYTNDATHAFVRGAAGSINSSTITFNDCIFENRSTVATSGVELNQAIVLTAASGGRLNLAYPRVFGATNGSTSTGVYVACPAFGSVASDWVSVQSS